MFIDENDKWINLDAINAANPYKGYSKLDTPELRAAVGLREIADPQPPEPPAGYSVDEAFTRGETNDRMPPYITWELKKPEQLLALRVSKLKQIRDELTENGGCLVDTKWFHTDVKSKQQQMALAMAGTNLPTGLMWKTMDGTFVQMTPTLAQELFAAQMTREATIFGICEAKQHDDTPINEGWPDRYVEEVAA